MSRTKWYFRPNRAYPMGICLHHKREIFYDEGRAKGCVSRRRCKWFRGPTEAPTTGVIEVTSCPAEEEWEYEEPEEPEEDDEGKELRYECQTCGNIFDEPIFLRETIGECWGRPAHEERSCCPRCKSSGYIEVYV